MARLARAYPGDSGAFAPLLLNLVYLNPGESLFLPARTPHAYLRGTGVEVMACSDNVLRAGLTDKHVDKPELLATVEFSIMYPEVLRPDYVGIEQVIPIPVDDFRLSFLRPDGPTPFPVGGQGEIELLYGLRGQMTLTSAEVKPGRWDPPARSRRSRRWRWPPPPSDGRRRAARGPA